MYKKCWRYFFANGMRPTDRDKNNGAARELVETSQKWKTDVVDLAKAELVRRGIALKIPGHRRRIKIKYERKIDSIKSGAEYTDRSKY